MRTLGLVLLLIAGIGCANEYVLPNPFAGPAPLPEPPPPTPAIFTPAEGSLWQGDSSRRFLAFENRAKAVGDLVTVMIDEEAMAENEATTDLERKSSFDATLDSDVALQTVVTRTVRNVLGFLGFTDQKNDSEPTAELNIVEAETTNKFEGDGSMKREATFTTTVACLVTEVMPSGLLKIEGERHLRINRETQVIRLTGFVRPEDVRLDNTIPSTLIASADIHYGGVGLAAEQQSAPWLYRVFSVVLPF